MRKILLIISLLIGLNSFAQDDFFWSYSHPKNLYDTLKIQCTTEYAPNYNFYANIYTQSGDSAIFIIDNGFGYIQRGKIPTQIGRVTPFEIVNLSNNTMTYFLNSYGYIITKRNDLTGINLMGSTVLNASSAHQMVDFRLDKDCIFLSTDAIKNNKLLSNIMLMKAFVTPHVDLTGNTKLKYLSGIRTEDISNRGLDSIWFPNSPDLYEISIEGTKYVSFSELNPNIHSFLGGGCQFVQSEVDKILKYFIDSNRIPNDLLTNGIDEIILCGQQNSEPSAIGLGYVSTLISRGWAVCVTTPPTNPPHVSTLSATMISTNSATLNGSVTSDSGSPASDRGLCWSTSINPTVSNTHSSSGSGLGGFSVNATSLSANTLYHVRAYAYNSYGLGYGEDVTFTTTSAAQEFPQITTVSPTEIRTTTATSGGIITYDGNYPIIEKGVCWSTSTNPTYSDAKTNDGTGTSDFTSNLTGLSPSTTYHIRSYARNRYDNGVFITYLLGYGEDIIFTTASTGTCDLPIVTTNTVNTITTNSAFGGGNVTSDGGCEVTLKGLCWSTSINPTIANSHTTDGSGVGAFSSSITGLTCGTTYYVRAYATNSSGTAYGNQVSFTTGTTDYPMISLQNTIDTSTCGFTGNFTSSLSLAQTACQDFKDYADGLCSIQLWGGYAFKGQSLSVGTQLYAYNQCNISTDTGYWLYSPDTPNRAIVHLINGVIQSITQCP